MSDIKEGDKIQYAPYHKEADPKNAKSQTTGEVTHVNEKPRKNNPEHKTYTVLNDNTGKESTYGERSITEKLEE
ncbi:hypothetical protein PNOK_0135700 [Pyrrhoderma noxium]|uniref:Hypervirulence associated protein TUDOR domain-containing protein n=1 Tax=Pyrrhoderma noxium TaxID=2282107 RepID=A0A286UXG2_9AGAM|nr:hypothetical protein PNOK_0135700 [Pyrrhoderma noxium]